MKKMLGMICLAIFFVTPVFAQDKQESQGKSTETKKTESKTVEIEEIVVSATRTEKKIDEAPASVNVITKADIEQFRAQSLLDAIVRVPGIYVNKSSTGSVAMRGLSGENRTLILLNGMPMNDGYSGAVDWKAMSVNDVERIEVTRGGGSALYGGNAMGGVVNIVTKKPQKREGSVYAGIGSDQTNTFGGYYGDKSGPWSVRAGIEYEKTDGYANDLVLGSIKDGEGDLSGGYPIDGKTGGTQWVCGDKGDAGLKRTNASLMTAYDLTDTGSVTFNFQMGTDEKWYSRPRTLLKDADGNAQYAGDVNVGDGQITTVSDTTYLGRPYEKTDYIASMNYNEKFGFANLTAIVGYKQMDTWYTTPTSGTYDDASGTRTDYGTQTWNADLQTDMTLFDRHQLTIGANAKADDFDLDDYNVIYYRDEDTKTDRLGGTSAKALYLSAYIQDEWTALDMLTVYAGARFDYWKAYDAIDGDIGSEEEMDDATQNTVSPQLAAVTHPFEGTYLRASASKSFRPPTVYELFSKAAFGTTVYHNNPDLEPETAWTYEGGLDQYFFSHRLKLSATYFFTKAEDFIQSYWDDSYMNSYKENVGVAEIQGVELEASVTPFDWVNVWANFSTATSEITENDRKPELVGKKLTYYPEKTFNTGIDLMARYFKLSFAGNYTGQFYVNDMNDDIEGRYGTYSKRWVWDSKLTFSPLSYAECSLSVNNIFDEEYYTYSIAPGRSYLVEARVRF